MVNGLEQSEMYQHEEIELHRQKSPGKCLSLIQFQKYIKLGDGAQTTLNCLMFFFFFLSPNQMAIILLWSGCVTGQERTNGDFSPLLSSLQKHSTFKGVMGLYVCKQYAKLFCILSTSPQKRVYVTLADMGLWALW